MPCLHPDCVAKNPNATHDKTSDEMCSICWGSGLGQAPSLMIKCGHIFHAHCLMMRLKKRWFGPQINFNYLDCPECKKSIEAPHIPFVLKELAESRKLEAEVIKKAVERAKHEGVDKDPRLNV